MSATFFRTRVSVDVLSEEPIGDLGLSSILYGITRGDMVGGPVTHDQTTLTPKQVSDALREFGSAPDFFQLDEHGVSLEDRSLDGTNLEGKS